MNFPEYFQWEGGVHTTWMKVRKVVMPRGSDRNGDQMHGWKGEDQFSLRSETVKFEEAGRDVHHWDSWDFYCISKPDEWHLCRGEKMPLVLRRKANGSAGSHQLSNNGHKFWGHLINTWKPLIYLSTSKDMTSLTYQGFCYQGFKEHRPGQKQNLHTFKKRKRKKKKKPTKLQWNQTLIERFRGRRHVDCGCPESLRRQQLLDYKWWA